MWYPLFLGCIRPENLLICTYHSAAGQHPRERAEWTWSFCPSSVLRSLLISFPPLTVRIYSLDFISPSFNQSSSCPACPPPHHHNSFLCISSLPLYANPLSSCFLSVVSAMRLSGVRTMQGRIAETLVAACCKTSYHHAAIMIPWYSNTLMPSAANHTTSLFFYREDSLQGWNRGGDFTGSPAMPWKRDQDMVFI